MVLKLRRHSARSSGARGHVASNSEDSNSSAVSSELLTPLTPDAIAAFGGLESRRWSRRTSSSSHQSTTLPPSSSKGSFETDANESLCTESSGSTVPGPGVLTGRVIKAIGNIAVLRIDNILIKRRMSAYRNIFPHGRDIDGTEDGGEEMYSEVLEFTRPGIYPAAVRKEALDMLMVQINIRETNQLMKALDDHFDYEDVQSFLFQVLEYDTQANQKINANLVGGQEVRFASSLPLAFFIFRLSFSQRKSHQVAVNSFLLAMCTEKSLLADNLLRIFKFGQDSDYLDKLEDCAPEERQTLWKVLHFLRPGELPYLEERLQMRTGRIYQVMKRMNPSKDDLTSACYDLIEFSRKGLEHLIISLHMWAFSRIFTFLARGGVFWDVLISTLGSVPHGDKYRILSCILYCTVPELNLSPSATDRELAGAYRQSYIDEEESDAAQDLDAHILDNFFRFVIQAFTAQPSLRAAMMLDQHFLSIIAICLSPPQVPSSSAEVLRLITGNLVAT